MFEIIVSKKGFVGMMRNLGYNEDKQDGFRFGRSREDCVALEEIFKKSVKNASLPRYRDKEFVLVCPDDIALEWDAVEKQRIGRENSFEIVRYWNDYYSTLLQGASFSDGSDPLRLWSLYDLGDMSDESIRYSMFSEPVTFARVLENGKISIDNGNHRVLAAQRNSVLVPVLCPVMESKPWAARVRLAKEEERQKKYRSLVSLSDDNEKFVTNDLDFDV